MQRKDLIQMYQHVLNNPHWFAPPTPTVGFLYEEMDKQAWRGIAYHLAGITNVSEETDMIAELCKQLEN
jgi:hypothetical protein